MSKTTKKVSKPKKSNNVKKKTNSNKKVVKDTKVKEEKIETKEQKVTKEPINKKRNILLPILCVIALLSGLLFFIIKEYPTIKENIELKLIEKEVNNLIKENNIDKVKEKIKEKNSDNELNIYDNNIKLYLLENISISKEIEEIKNNSNVSNYLDINKLGDETVLKENEELITKLNDIEERIKLIKDTKYEYKNEKINKSYLKLRNIIDDNYTFNDINDIKDKLNSSKPINEYLIKNKNVYNKDEEIVFLKRNKYNEFDKLIKESNCNDCNNIKYKLIEDTKGPVITASDIKITEGTKINIMDKIKCVDDVDDTVECKISGTYNSSKKGTYTITITSTDKSNNKSSKSIKVIVEAKVTKTVNREVPTGTKPYYIEVIRNQNVVIVYGKDSNNKYTKVVKVFVVSVGRNGKTPTGTFKTTKGYQWGALINNVWGQYTTRITGSYLFHSVPYYTKNKGNLEWQEYNKLGTAASAGCVRMTVRDAKWIYDNIANGTTVKIYDGSLPSGVTKPSATKISSSSPNKGWDPTDPDPNNPWRK